MKRLQGTHPDVRLIVVGAGSDLDRIRNLVRTEGLTNVTFLPPQPLEQIARTWTLADVGLSTLRNLPLAQATRPAKVLAAMASGKPVVYAGEGEGARLLTDADAGIIVRPEDPAGLADAIARLLDDPSFAGKLGMNGRAYVEHHLTWGAIVDRWLDELPGTGPRVAKAFRE
jgi:glycosyltransferase involved in cell wall biosynthesis